MVESRLKSRCGRLGRVGLTTAEVARALAEPPAVNSSSPPDRPLASPVAPRSRGFGAFQVFVRSCLR